MAKRRRACSLLALAQSPNHWRCETGVILRSPGRAQRLATGIIRGRLTRLQFHVAELVARLDQFTHQGAKTPVLR